jgi:hypothetical protein
MSLPCDITLLSYQIMKLNEIAVEMRGPVNNCRQNLAREITDRGADSSATEFAYQYFAGSRVFFFRRVLE